MMTKRVHLEDLADERAARTGHQVSQEKSKLTKYLKLPKSANQFLSYSKVIPLIKQFCILHVSHSPSTLSADFDVWFPRVSIITMCPYQASRMYFILPNQSHPDDQRCCSYGPSWRGSCNQRRDRSIPHPSHCNMLSTHDDGNPGRNYKPEIVETESFYPRPSVTMHDIHVWSGTSQVGELRRL